LEKIMKNKCINIAACVALIVLSNQVVATTFQNLPNFNGWTFSGNGGYQNSTDGVVDVVPGQIVNFVTTNGGVSGNNLGAPGTNGSTASSLFTATAGQVLSFSFKFVTSDGSGFPDYSWAQVFAQGSATPYAVLFTAATNPSLGNTVPASDLPLIPITATLNPAVGSIPFTGGAPLWSPLGSSSNTCFAAGCGYTSWVDASYTIADAGNYSLVFGVANANDTAFDSGLAWQGAEIGGAPIGGGTVPEPGMLSLLGIGLAGFSIMRRHRNSKV
jgi:hypothetical protein